MSRCEGFFGQVRNPVTELIVKFCDKAASLEVEGMLYGESDVAAVAVMGGVLGDLVHIAGRGHIAIPTHPVPSHLPLTAIPSAMPASSSPAAINMCLGPGP